MIYIPHHAHTGFPLCVSPSASVSAPARGTAPLYDISVARPGARRRSAETAARGSIGANLRHAAVVDMQGAQCGCWRRSQCTRRTWRARAHESALARLLRGVGDLLAFVIVRAGTTGAATWQTRRARAAFGVEPP